MRWRDAFGLAGRDVLRRPGRAVLTVLAVALASALLTALMSIARTAETRVLDELAKGGPLAGIKVTAAAPDPGQVDNDNARPGPPRDLDDAGIRSISRLPDVKTVVPITAARIVVLPDPLLAPRGRPTPPSEDGPPRDSGPISATLVGLDLARATQVPLTVLAGRLPAPGSVTEVALTPPQLERLGVDRSALATVVGKELQLGAPRVFGDDRGGRVRARWARAQVVGVVAQEAAEGDVVASDRQVRLAREWTAAGVDGGRRLQLSTSPYSGLFVVARGLDKVARVRAEIARIGYANAAPENLIASVQRYLRVVEIVLSGIGSIALVIASLGISNAVLAAVRERRREIGVLKAIGARNRDVLRVFLVEAAVLGFLGGLVGTALGYAVARIVGSIVNGYLTSQGLAGVRPGLPVVLLIGGVAGSTVLAIVAGGLPALRAARLPAREAVEA